MREVASMHMLVVENLHTGVTDHVLSPAGDVEWNFEKFLINRQGDAIARFKSSIEPDGIELTKAIEKLLD